MNGHHPLDFNRERNVRDDLIHTPQPVSKADEPTKDVEPHAYVLPTLHHKKMYAPVTTIYPNGGE